MAMLQGNTLERTLSSFPKHTVNLNAFPEHYGKTEVKAIGSSLSRLSHMASIPSDTGFYLQREELLYTQLPSQPGTARGGTANIKFSLHQIIVQKTKEVG